MNAEAVSLRLETPLGAPFALEVVIDPRGPRRFRVTEPGRGARIYELARAQQPDYLDLFEALARDLGTRVPLARTPPPPRKGGPPLRPLLTEAVAPEVLYGYGDPCVARVGEREWRLLVTSNDAPNAFPILASSDLTTWQLTGFVFPRAQTPAWALTGPNRADFWAPEMHWVREEYWVCFTARAQDRSLAIGLARSRSPDGPFKADEAPIVTGDVIDAHILVDAGGAPWLIWKKDDNGVWPGRLAALLHREPARVSELFGAREDQRTAVLALTSWPWVETLEPMEQFFVLQPLIEAATADFTGFAARLSGLGARASGAEAEDIAAISRALRTRIHAQRLSADGRRLEGEPAVILENDQPWEAHVIEGVWITQEGGRYYLLYGGNDFSTARYGIGAAVADAPTGPYRKSSEVLLSSSAEWWGPGHPSVSIGADGRHHVFLHAFRAGVAGYKAFRASLTAPIRFAGGVVSLDGSV
ncbi:glycoside hydrolase family 43 [Sorangium cellulosum]|uniref:Glycoside hydrolase family 43 n=1 Tax=Sorangium cellulosum TaxID=56 RepID=A0A150RW11_SORCE|nr:glycoside hydrolase family 43 [Sorangium cellulosum]KYF92576.1 glycoside hydrolase family 43 [Sorangium cellulosum]